MKLIRLFFVATMFAVLSISASAQKMKPEEVLAKHLESFGAAADRNAIKNQMAVGDVVVKFISQKGLTTQGRVLFVSEGAKNFLGMNLMANDYSSEKFSYDGKNVKVGYASTNQRSPLGSFVKSTPVLIRDGLLGGALMTSWAMFHTETSKAKLSFEGTKKIDGRETYQIGFSPKSGGDIDVVFYFDKETFRHVRSEYKRVWSAAVGRTIDESARQSESRLKITENFSDFKAVKGVTMPHLYKLNYSITGQNGTTEIEWEMKVTDFAFNQNLDANSFNAEAN